MFSHKTARSVIPLAMVLALVPTLSFGNDEALSVFMGRHADLIETAIASSDRAVGLSLKPTNQLDAIDSARFIAMSRLASKQGTTEIKSNSSQQVSVAQNPQLQENVNRNERLVIESKTKSTFRTNTILVDYDADSRQALVILEIKH